MALVSMKCESKNEGSLSNNEYGYGLRIRLNDDQCEALGITTPPKAGTVLSLSASAFVASATESVKDDEDDTGNEVYLELQITDLEIGKDSKNGPHASMLYGSGD